MVIVHTIESNSHVNPRQAIEISTLNPLWLVFVQKNTGLLLSGAARCFNANDIVSTDKWELTTFSLYM